MGLINTGKGRKVSLKSGRPPAANIKRPKLSQKITNHIINTFHALNKKLAQAEAKGDATAASAIKKKINAVGGLKTYQAASIQGQANDRGGDSSIILMEWLQPVLPDLRLLEKKPRLLEVGALSISNACSTSNVFDVTRIDLNSQSPGIKQQDFMERPIPTSRHEQFDVISLSLVVNFVGDAQQRGEMLKRTLAFLERKNHNDMQNTLPSLFLVLPAPCIINSRYMNEEQLTIIMASLGYVMTHRKQSKKLVYYLWLLRDPEEDEQDFPKVQLRDGAKMNNFSIVLR